MNSLVRSYSEVRSSVSKSDRDLIVGSCVYRCERCDARTTIEVAVGVIMPDVRRDGLIGVPAPEVIDCELCHAMTTYEKGTFLPFSTEHRQRPGMFPYLRVPSRRAVARLVGAGLFEAQVVPRKES